MKVGIVASLLCCLVAGILASICGFGVKCSQATMFDQQAYGITDRNRSQAMVQEYFGNTGAAKLFNGLGNFFAKKEPQSWDEMMQWAANASARGDYMSAERYLNMAMTSAPNDARVATAAASLASVESRNGRIAEAERLYKKAIELDAKFLPANSPDITRLRSDLASLQRRKRQEALKVGRARAPQHRAHASRQAAASKSGGAVGFNIGSCFGD